MRRIARHKSVRARLLAIALMPVLIVMPIFGGVVVAKWSQRFDRLLIAKVNGELTIAHQYLAGLKDRAHENLTALGASAALRDALAEGDGALPALLEDRRQALGFDFLYYIAPDGRGIAAASHGVPARPRDWPVVEAALAGAGGTVIDVLDADELAQIHPDLAARAALDLVPTRAAVPTTRSRETRGMVIHSAAPVTAGQGVLVAGLLLNRNLDFIDTINALVYPEASLTEGSIGTTTLFLDDVRVSTNVRLFENVRALGTRVSREVRAAVLDQGRVWLDRAFVVNDWYISAYEPLTDSRGARVGMLYVGFLDSPYREARARTLWLILAGFAVLVAVSVPLLLRLARGIFRPLEQMVETIDRVEAGDLSARTGIADRDNEVALVAAQLDHLLEQVQERNRRLSQWADELEDRVAERTRELAEANQRLEATTKQLVVSEKLAVIGEITASVAHEINNPVAVIQGNIDVIQEQLGPAAGQLATEFGLIHEQVHRINVLVSKLLQFARPEEYADGAGRHAPDQLIRDTLPLVQHLLAKVRITPELDLTCTRQVAMNPTELQQVLINLIVNAIHAMPDGGLLGIRCADRDADGIEGIEIRVSDTGTGMPPEVLARVFDPFFTTKKAEGTGLGLSIIRNIVTRAGGNIAVDSQPGQGSTFSVFLPAALDPAG